MSSPCDVSYNCVAGEGREPLWNSAGGESSFVSWTGRGGLEMVRLETALESCASSSIL